MCLKLGNTINIIAKHEYKETPTGMWFIYEAEDLVQNYSEVIDRGNIYTPVFRSNDGDYSEGEMFSDIKEAVAYIEESLELE